MSDRCVPVAEGCDRRACRRRRQRRAGRLHPPDSVRGRARDHPPGQARPAPDPDDAGPDLRPDDRHGLRARADVLLGRQSRASVRCIACATRSSTAGRSRWNSTSTATPAWPPPIAPARRGCRSACCAATSTTTWTRRNPRIRRVDCPFTGERLAAVPAINPDVTILHAQRADRARQRRDPRHRRRAARSGAGGADADRHGRGDRRPPAAGDERDRAAALDRQRGRALPGRRLSVLRARPLRARQRLLPGAGTRSRATASSFTGVDAANTCSTPTTTAVSSPACRRKAA